MMQLTVPIEEREKEIIIINDGNKNA
jgi:hypothetical protein